MKRVALLGATGSIGRQALEIIAAHPELELAAAASGSQPIDGLAPLTQTGGDLTALLEEARPDVVLNAVVGFAGLPATLWALERGIDLALANKESLVAAGDLATAAWRRGGGRLLPGARARPRRPVRRRRRGAPPRRTNGSCRMSILIAILGLALLVLIHEAGHFYTARAVGMRPRRFYVGFPPALFKTTRNGIEYGLGAIPPGGYVKIPGMHRPAPSDLDNYFGPALFHDTSLVGPVERLKRLVAEGNFSEAREELKSLDAALAQTRLPHGAARAARRGRDELADALGADAYWRQATWKRVTVIAAGPLTNIIFAILVLAIVYMIGIPFDASPR